MHGGWFFFANGTLHKLLNREPLNRYIETDFFLSANCCNNS
jgi:hypothetical protein